jgi:hypothetical protein
MLARTRLLMAFARFAHNFSQVQREHARLILSDAPALAPRADDLR